MQTITFGPGTPARCNRCDARSPLPKAVNAVRENSAAYRIQDFATLDCGHMDCHWVYAADLPTINPTPKHVSTAAVLDVAARLAENGMVDVQIVAHHIADHAGLLSQQQVGKPAEPPAWLVAQVAHILETEW